MKDAKTNYYFYVTVNGLPVTEYNHQHNNQHNTFIEGRDNSDYVLNFRNNTSTRVKVIMSVDGLDIMEGKPASKNSRGYVVPANDSIAIPGWRVNDGTVAKFVFRPPGGKENKTYVEELASAGFSVDAGNVGVLGCMVFQEKWQGHRGIGGMSISSGIASAANIPFGNHYLNVSGSADSALGSAVGGYATAVSSTMAQNSLGTAFGETQTFATQKVDFVAATAYPQWVAVIQYDTVTGLKRRGVVIEKSPQASAFPGDGDGCYVPKR